MSKSASLTESQWLAEVERLAAESRPHQVTIPEDVMHRIDLARNRLRPLSWPKLTKLLIDTGLMPKGTKSHTISEIWRKSQVGC